MPFYKYAYDKKVSDVTEMEISEKLKLFYEIETLEFRKDREYDIKAITPRGKIILIEIKEDFLCEKTGNVGLEFSCRGKPSGINVTKSEYYVYKIHSPNGILFIRAKTSRLKKAIEKKEYFKTVNGGDKNSNSLNYLFKLNVFLSFGSQIFTGDVLT